MFLRLYASQLYTVRSRGRRGWSELAIIDVHAVVFASIGAGAKIATSRAGRPGARPL